MLVNIASTTASLVKNPISINNLHNSKSGNERKKAFEENLIIEINEILFHKRWFVIKL